MRHSVARMILQMCNTMYIYNGKSSELLPKHEQTSSPGVAGSSLLYHGRVGEVVYTRLQCTALSRYSTVGKSTATPATLTTHVSEILGEGGCGSTLPLWPHLRHTATIAPPTPRTQPIKYLRAPSECIKASCK